MAQKIVRKWADYSRLGDLSPHDLRRTAITRALESGLTYRQVQMMSKHTDSKTVMDMILSGYTPSCALTNHVMDSQRNWMKWLVAASVVT